jgi:hypothetical protein
MSKSLSPIYSLVCGYIFLIVIIFSLYGFGFYEGNGYFQWGPPLIFFDREITSNLVFYILLGIIFVHQIITNWIYEVVVPFIFNTVQNPKHTVLEYTKTTYLAIINSNSLYNQLHLAFLINGITSQISFLVALILADFITLTYINWQYLKLKNPPEQSQGVEIV